ncbi:sulfite exporter TauE/SafE family protein [Nitrolancea hollandica]|uniref:Probable membrane transporter protein n=1 Tax=Nitrolancea hollandica Lb TaxID=1129897 RepID=I4EH59_9BACT|nr:sulfite exporter TauE/SafE family protein [Nitrolancea hollandica]CCF84021.1 conserved membrane hypothetical protein [Nitrolancea hollandica Lb]
MSPLTSLEVLITSGVAGVLGSMVGLGGGIFIVPVLSVFFGIPLKTAIAASAVGVIVNSITGTSVYLKHRLTNIRLALLMELTTTIGAVAGGLIVVSIAPEVLEIIFALALLGMGAAMFFRQRQSVPPVSDGPDPLRLRHVYFAPVRRIWETYIPQHLLPGMMVGTFAGLMSGMLGIGGGAVKVPVMNGIMRVPVKPAAGTSMFMVGITVSASAFVYYAHDLIDPSVTVPTVLGILVGSQFGVRLGRTLPAVYLVRILVVVLVYLAITLLLKSFGIQIPGT